jgi:hypothetical protein
MANAFILALVYAAGKVQDDQEGLELNGTRQLIVHNNDFNLLGENINAVDRKRDSVQL